VRSGAWYSSAKNSNNRQCKGSKRGTQIKYLVSIRKCSFSAILRQSSRFLVRHIPSTSPGKPSISLILLQTAYFRKSTLKCGCKSSPSKNTRQNSLSFYPVPLPSLFTLSLYPLFTPSSVPFPRISKEKSPVREFAVRKRSTGTPVHNCPPVMVFLKL